jgi:hypothetical protein
MALPADMFEIVNEATPVHPLFQGYVDFYSWLLKEEKLESWFVVQYTLCCVHTFSVES